MENTQKSPILEALKNGRNITINPELVIKLIQVDGLRSNIVTITTETDPKLKKTGNPYADKPVKKWSKYQVMINTNYQSGVTNELVREHKNVNNYQKGKSTMTLAKDDNYNACLAVNVSEFLANGKLNPNFGKLMLICRPVDTSFKRQSEYTLYGKLLYKELIKLYIPEKSHAVNQGSDKEILWRNIYLENVREMVIDGTTIKNF